MLIADRERLQERRQRMSSETWVGTVLNYGRWFRLAAGRADRLAAKAARRGRRWLQGVSHSRAAFAERLAIASPQLLDESWPTVRGQSSLGASIATSDSGSATATRRRSPNNSFWTSAMLRRCFRFG